MLRLVLGCMLVAMVAADCGPLQRIKVKNQWAEAYGTGLQRGNLGHALWRGIFTIAPESRDLFDRVGGDDTRSASFQAHSLRVLGGFDMVISMLDDEAAFNAQLAHLRGQHIERNIPGNYFEAFGNALMQVIPAALGRCFDQDAWNSCYEVISSGIKA